MNRILLLLGLIFFSVSVNGQILTANSIADFNTWTTSDLDGDGFIWHIGDLTGVGTPLDAQGECFISNSYDATALGLNPDNLGISPAMDLSGLLDVTVAWSVGSPESTSSFWFEENYSVYLVTTIADVTTSTPIFTETLPGGEVMYSHSINTTVYAGASAVYLVFRHHDCYDENFLVLDDVTVTAGTAAPPCNTTLTTSATHETAPSANDGTATVTATGGTAPYTYSWAPSGGTGTTATGLAPGTYTVTVTDDNFCVETTTVTIEPFGCALFLSVSSTGETSPGGNDGTATVTPTGGVGPYTYSWSPSGGSGATATGLAPGSYLVTVTDANACSEVGGVVIQPFTCDLTATVVTTDVTTAGGANGTAIITVIGGTLPYTYSWSPTGGSASFATALAIGTYTVTISDGNGCSIEIIVIINDFGCTLTALGSGTSETAPGANDGTASIAGFGGTTPYTYIWFPSGGASSTAVGLAPGTYTGIVMDADLCSATDIVLITAAPEVSVETIADAVEIKVFPNPVRTTLYVESEEQIVLASVIGIDGKVVIEQLVNDKLFSINVSELNAGSYYYQMQTSNGQIIRKAFIKQ